MDPTDNQEFDAPEMDVTPMESDPTYHETFGRGVMPSHMWDGVSGGFGSGNKRSIVTGPPISLGQLSRMAARRV